MQYPKLILQIPFGREEHTIIAGASENGTHDELIKDVKQTAREYGDTIVAFISDGKDVTAKADDNTIYETFDKSIIMDVEKENNFLFPHK